MLISELDGIKDEIGASANVTSYLFGSVFPET